MQIGQEVSKTIWFVSKMMYYYIKYNVLMIMLMDIIIMLLWILRNSFGVSLKSIKCVLIWDCSPEAQGSKPVKALVGAITMFTRVTHSYLASVQICEYALLFVDFSVRELRESSAFSLLLSTSDIYGLCF